MHCSFCEESGSSLRCSRCKMTWYCSSEHQKLDWPKHRAFCSNVGPFLAKNFPKFTFGPCPTSKGSNLLVLLHGFGDSDTNFSRFGKSLELPHTDVLALCGKYDLLGEGFCWYLDSKIVGAEFSSLKSENERIIPSDNNRKAVKH